MSDWPALWAALCADILASAKDINAARSAGEAEVQVEGREA